MINFFFISWFIPHLTWIMQLEASSACYTLFCGLSKHFSTRGLSPLFGEDLELKAA